MRIVTFAGLIILSLVVLSLSAYACSKQPAPYISPTKTGLINSVITVNNYSPGHRVEIPTPIHCAEDGTWDSKSVRVIADPGDDMKTGVKFNTPQNILDPSQISIVSYEPSDSPTIVGYNKSFFYAEGFNFTDVKERIVTYSYPVAPSVTIVCFPADRPREGYTLLPPSDIESWIAAPAKKIDLTPGEITDTYITLEVPEGMEMPKRSAFFITTLSYEDTQSGTISGSGVQYQTINAAWVLINSRPSMWPTYLVIGIGSGALAIAVAVVLYKAMRARKREKTGSQTVSSAGYSIDMGNTCDSGDYC